MKTTACCLLLSLALLPGGAQAQAPENDPYAAARAIAETEAKFYEMGQAEGTRAAFLAYLAPEAIVFSPGPVSARSVWEKRPAAGLSLKWKPAFIGVAQSGDLAFSTGPAEWRKAKEDEKPFGYGQFVTIWKKQADGAWKVALDVGIEVPGATREEPAETVFSVGEPFAPGVSTEKKAVARMLRNAEAKSANVARTDSTASVIGSANDDVIVLREGVFPAAGKAAATLMLSVGRGALTREKLGGGMSAAGDLVYSYGSYTLKHPEKTERGNYLQVWRAESDGTFKLALDYQSPLPAEEKK